MAGQGGCRTANGSCRRKRCGAGTCPHLAHHREPELTSIIILLFAIVLLQVAIQAVSVLNQMRLFAVDVDAVASSTAAFVTSSFIGGPISCGWQSSVAVRRVVFFTTAGAAIARGLALIEWLTQREQALALVQLRTS